MSLSEYLRQGDGLGGVTTERRLLQSIVEVSRSVFSAAATSIFMVDQRTGELVFEAVAGEGAAHLLGRRFPANTGIVGFVAACGQPMLVDDLSESPDFARQAAESTGYVPNSIMAAPLIRDGDCIGVLEVLDQGTRHRLDLDNIDLLGLVATQAATGLDLLTRLQQATRPESQVGSQVDQTLRRIADRLPDLPPPAADSVLRLLVSVEEFIAARS